VAVCRRGDRRGNRRDDFQFAYSSCAPGQSEFAVPLECSLQDLARFADAGEQ
jgi:hypothetical protein